MELGPNIARNTALSENVFMMVICIELRIPLFVVGKPGSSKSLAKTVVYDNMQGDAARSNLFKTLKQVFGRVMLFPVHFLGPLKFRADINPTLSIEYFSTCAFFYSIFLFSFRHFSFLYFFFLPFSFLSFPFTFSSFLSFILPFRLPCLWLKPFIIFKHP